MSQVLINLALVCRSSSPLTVLESIQSWGNEYAPTSWTCAAHTSEEIPSGRNMVRYRLVERLRLTAEFIQRRRPVGRFKFRLVLLDITVFLLHTPSLPIGGISSFSAPPFTSAINVYFFPLGTQQVCVLFRYCFL